MISIWFHEDNTTSYDYILDGDGHRIMRVEQQHGYNLQERTYIAATAMAPELLQLARMVAAGEPDTQGRAMHLIDKTENGGNEV